MELIQSPHRSYWVTKVLYESDMCRGVLAEDGDGVTVLINQITDKSCIKEHLPTLGVDCGGFIERFIFRQSLCAVFDYQPGAAPEMGRGAAEILQACLDISLGAAVCDVPEAYLPSVLRGRQFVVTDDGRVVWNKLMVFTHPDNGREEQGAESLAALLTEYIGGAEPKRPWALTGLRELLSMPYSSPTELHLALRRFSQDVRRETVAERIRRRVLRARTAAGARLQQAARRGRDAVKSSLPAIALWVLVAALLTAAMPLYAHMTGFADILYAARLDNGRLAVLEQRNDRYQLTLFDENGQYLRRYSQDAGITAGGRAIRYVGMVPLGDRLYLHRKSYGDDGSHNYDSIMEFSAAGMRELLQTPSEILEGSLSVAEGRLYFLSEISASGGIEGFAFAAPSRLVLMCREDDDRWTQQEPIPPAEYSAVPVYAGQNRFLYADRDARAMLYDGQSGEKQPLAPSGSAERISVYRGQAAYFDFSTGAIALYDTDGRWLSTYTPEWIPGAVSLGADGLAVVELDGERRGHQIHLPEWDGSAWQDRVFTPGYICVSALRDGVPAAALIFLGCFLLRGLLSLFRKRKLPVVLRIAAVLLPIALLGVYAAVMLYARVLFAQLSGLETREFAAFTQSLDALEIHEAILSISPDTPADSDEYRRLTAALGQLTPERPSGDTTVIVRYFDVFLATDAGLVTLYSAQYPKGSHARYCMTVQDYAELADCVATGEQRHYNAVYAVPYACDRVPIYDESGAVYAVLEPGLDLRANLHLAKLLARRQVFPLTAALLVVFAVFMLVTTLSLRSLQVLKAGVERIADGERGVRVAVETKDEFGAIAWAFNQMSAYVDERVRESESYYRFVPQEIFNLFGKSLDAMRRGDSIKLPAALMCLGISSWPGADSRTPGGRELSFCFDRIAGMVRREGGYVKDIDASGTFCFFRGDVRRALTAALEICETLSDYGISVTLGFGEVTLTVMGEASGLQVALVSDLSEPLRALRLHTATFGSRILLTEDAFQALERREDFHGRYLGKTTVRDSVLGLHDLFDADSRDIYALKLRSLKDFSAGVSCFERGDWSRAHDAFIRVLRVFPGDHASRQYLRLCEERRPATLSAVMPELADHPASPAGDDQTQRQSRH